MAETLLFKTDKEPTFWNKEAAIGFFLASVVGLVIGGFIGKDRMRREKTFGKPVSDHPSFWNKDTLLGAMIGGAVLGIAAGLTLFALPIATMTPAAFGLAAIGLQMVPIVGTVVGAYLGGKSGQDDARKEYVIAQQQQAQAVGRSQNVEIAQEQSPGKSYAQSIEQERALAAAQVNAR